ncbi:PREDICTED: chlorophyllase-2, chloroplastic-like [Camelina sativa]|uniref:chlorophyllase n=1 Tax=Camelina sativa TaxID=90675 RepID=A0ABM0Y542_CAMSA|nr:PREDICTED: chlorophyllase-2, chloroplastic-like [Camelina sativa]
MMIFYIKNAFEDGKYKTDILTLDSSSRCCKTTPSPPKQLLVATPVEEGEYPVVMLLHGYLLYNSFYSQLMSHVSSHGFILIAPQLYSIAGPDITDEIKSTAEIIHWLSVGSLNHFLPAQVIPNLSKFALSGHSRGGKTAFAVALKKFGYSSDLKISTLIGIDPVDGTGKGQQTPPPVLAYEPNSLDLDKMPVLVIGSGLVETAWNSLFPPCAHPGVNHEEFFRECQSPAWHFVAEDYGHLDMLDDNTKGIRGMIFYCLCKNGEKRRPMRRFVGGILVSFLKAYLEGDDFELVKIKDGCHKGLPIKIQEFEVTK